MLVIGAIGFRFDDLGADGFRPTSAKPAQPTVSHHLKVLVDAGLLNRDKRGVWAYFALVPGALDSLAAVLVSPCASRCGDGGNLRATGPRRIWNTNLGCLDI